MQPIKCSCGQFFIPLKEEFLKHHTTEESNWSLYEEQNFCNWDCATCGGGWVENVDAANLPAIIKQQEEFTLGGAL